jgi:7-cyano-7-deazaguanine reductase
MIEETMSIDNTSHSELGKKVEYDPYYNPEKLFPIPRKGKRDEIDIPEKLPFYGVDIWNHYEVSWLNAKGKPIVALAEISYDCTSPFIIESKSMKLYFNSFNNTKFNSVEEVQETIKKDIEIKILSPVTVRILPLDELQNKPLSINFDGICLDKLDIECSIYLTDASYLITENNIVTETLHSNLLKSNCLVTHQPDWGSVQINYKGKKINHEGLLRYIISFRNHNEFHEQCIERIFMDILRHCQPDELTVYGRYTRRGGLDINPFRSTKKFPESVNNLRLIRQ